MSKENTKGQSVVVGEQVPDLTIHATSDINTHLSALKNKHIILYFYPKDDTPGCTTEGKDFSELYEKFQKLDACIFGISRESLASHEKFKKKYAFPFELISDTDERLCQTFDVIKPKKLYGREYIGIERSTFLIDQQGVLRKEWRKVKVKGHAQEVLRTLSEL